VVPARAMVTILSRSGPGLVAQELSLLTSPGPLCASVTLSDQVFSPGSASNSTENGAQGSP
jgi:hypothetical protein